MLTKLLPVDDKYWSTHVVDLSIDIKKLMYVHDGILDSTTPYVDIQQINL